MPRSYIVLARNDLDANLLQVTDLKPNTSQKNPPIEHAPGQTGYLTHFRQNDAVATTVGGGGIRTTDAVYQGLTAYLIDNVENVGGGDITLSDADAATIARAILLRVAAGQSLLLADINTCITATAAASDLNGVVANSDSTGSVEEVLRLLAGEVYEVPAGSQVANAANAFPGTGVLHTPLGAFVPRTSASFRDVRVILYSGELNQSTQTGQLSRLAAATYSWTNPAFTYGAGGTALDAASIVVPATGIDRAVVTYRNTGAVL